MCAKRNSPEIRPEPAKNWILAALEEYELPLLRFARRLLDGKLEPARDAVQHTFLKLCEQSYSDVGDHLAAWLFQVCRNRVRDEFRRHKRGVVSTEDLHAVPDPKSPEPPMRTELTESAALIRNSVRQLPTAQREVVELWCDGLGYRDIASVLEKTENAVRGIMHRAILTMREHPGLRSLGDQPRDAVPTS